MAVASTCFFACFPRRLARNVLKTRPEVVQLPLQPYPRTDVARLWTIPSSMWRKSPLTFCSCEQRGWFVPGPAAGTTSFHVWCTFMPGDSPDASLFSPLRRAVSQSLLREDGHFHGTSKRSQNGAYNIRSPRRPDLQGRVDSSRLQNPA